MKFLLQTQHKPGTALQATEIVIPVLDKSITSLVAAQGWTMSKAKLALDNP